MEHMSKKRDNEDANGQIQDDIHEGRTKVTQAKYTSYRLHQHVQEESVLLPAGKLFLQYIVDCWAATEQGCL
jgi:hypothetical protein